MDGVIIKSLPNATFRVRLNEGHELWAYLSGKMKRNHIRITDGDCVVVAMSPYDLNKGRIVYRK